MISFDSSYPRLAESSHATRMVRAPRETFGGRLVVKGSSQPPLSHVVAMKWTPVNAGAVRMLRHCTLVGTAGGNFGASLGPRGFVAPAPPRTPQLACLKGSRLAVRLSGLPLELGS